MANGFNPLGALTAQIAQFAQERTSPQFAAAQQALAERQQEQVRDQMASQFIATADFSRDPAGALQTLASIKGDPNLLRASLDVRLKDRAFQQERERLGALAGQIEGVAEGGIDRPEAAQILGAFTRAGQAAPAGITGAAIAPSPEEQRAQRQNLELQQARLDLAKQTAESGKPLTGKQRVGSITSLRSKLNSTDDVKTFVKMRQAVNKNLEAARLLKAGEITRGAAQETILLNFQKSLDPTSVVRESEFARTGTGASILNQVDNLVDRSIQGGFIDNETVQSINNLMEQFARGAQELANRQVEDFRAIAADAGLNPNRVGELFTDFGAPAPSTTGQAAPAAPPQAGGQAVSGPGAPTGQAGAAPAVQAGTPPAPPANIDSYLDSLGLE